MNTPNEYEMVDIFDEGDEETLRHLGFFGEIECVEYEDDWNEDIEF